MTCIHHDSIIQSIFPALKILSVLHGDPFPAPAQRLATTDLSMVSTILFSPECHIVGIIEYVAFSDWLLSLSNMHLSFFHVFSLLNSSFCTE